MPRRAPHPTPSPTSIGRLEEIAMLVAVSGSGSITAASRQLAVPKSTVSRSITRLESSLGVALIRRTGTTYTLTDVGQQLAMHAAPHVASLRDATLAISGDSNVPHGTLRVTAPVDLGQTILGPLIPSFVAMYPRVRIDLDLTSRMVDLAAERFDAAIRATSRPIDSGSLVARKLGPIELRLFASPKYVTRRGRPREPEDLPGHDCVMPTFPNGRLTLTNDRASRTVVPGARVTGSDFLFIREAVVAGAGIGLLGWAAARDDVESGKLVRVLPEWSLRGGAVYLVYPPARPLEPKLVAFRDFVLEHVPRFIVSPA